MQVPTFIINTNPGHFRPGEPGLLIGTENIRPDEKSKARMCYHIRYADGVEDYTPMSDDVRRFTLDQLIRQEHLLPADKCQFTAVCQDTEQDGVKGKGIWTDGVGVFCDMDRHAAFYPIKGQEYTVTITKK